MQTDQMIEGLILESEQHRTMYSDALIDLVNEEKKVEHLRGLLKEMEWCGTGPDGWPRCPECLADRDYGHHEDNCRLYEEIKNEGT